MPNKKIEVYDKIKKDILDGSLPPGFPINENDLAKVLCVSKTPVREALRQLERENLIENTPGRGSAVTHITLQDVREIFEIREIIECGAVRRAAVICGKKEVLAVRKEFEKLSSKEAERDASVWGPEEDVHQFIVKSIGNRKLHETYLGLLDHIKRIRKHYGGRFSRQRFENMLTEHIEILDALLEANPERAEKAVQNHLRNAATYVLGLTLP
ncbi:MAG: GntR family transcriptional regulator [Thermodesulfobacteriota bacterium]